jgi:polyisoprenoid-binding protein YceI
MIARKRSATIVLMLTAAAAACTSGDVESAEAPGDVGLAGAQTIESAVPTPDDGAALRYVVAPEGNEVRYRVREQLVNVDLPNDAVGRSAAVTGALALDANGSLLPTASRFVVDASTFASDRDRRDGYVRGRLLNAGQHPTIQLVPTALRGLAGPLPTSGTRTFTLAADLTVRGVTRPTLWNVTARFGEGVVTGAATTSFTFDDFSLQQPRVPVVLSVADTIRLEYDFRLVREEAGAAR